MVRKVIVKIALFYSLTLLQVCLQVASYFTNAPRIFLLLLELQSCSVAREEVGILSDTFLYKLAGKV